MYSAERRLEPRTSRLTPASPLTTWLPSSQLKNLSTKDNHKAETAERLPAVGVVTSSYFLSASSPKRIVACSSVSTWTIRSSSFVRRTSRTLHPLQSKTPQKSMFVCQYSIGVATGDGGRPLFEPGPDRTGE